MPDGTGSRRLLYASSVYWNNSVFYQFFSWQKIPRSLVIIGLELSQVDSKTVSILTKAVLPTLAYYFSAWSVFILHLYLSWSVFISTSVWHFVPIVQICSNHYSAGVQPAYGKLTSISGNALTRINVSWLRRLTSVNKAVPMVALASARPCT